jgi:hypothetical protein
VFFTQPNDMRLFRLVFLLTIFLFKTIASFSQDKWHLLPEKPGKWNYSYHNEPYGPNAEKNYKLTPAELSAIKEKLAKLAEILSKNPVALNPLGFDPVAQGSLYCSDESNVPYSFPESEVNLKFYPLFGDNSGKVKRDWTEVSEITFFVNSISPSPRTFLNYRETGYSKDVELNNSVKNLNAIFICPEIIREIAPGITAYSDGTVIITNPDKPYWIPVTNAEWYDLQLEYEKLSLIQMNQDPYSEMSSYTYVKKQRDALTAEELQKVAQINNRPYMRINPEYFNKTLPKSAIQSITIRTLSGALDENGNCDSESVDYTALCRYTKAINFEALYKLLNISVSR